MKTEDEKTKNLKIKIEELCVKLNSEGIKSLYPNPDLFSPSLNEILSNIKWTILEDYPKLTFSSIYMNDVAFSYLRENGYLDTGVCWFCGEEPIGKEYTFTTTVNKSIHICKDCYNEEQKQQNMKSNFFASHILKFLKLIKITILFSVLLFVITFTRNSSSINIFYISTLVFWLIIQYLESITPPRFDLLFIFQILSEITMIVLSIIVLLN